MKKFFICEHYFVPMIQYPISIQFRKILSLVKVILRQERLFDGFVCLNSVAFQKLANEGHRTVNFKITYAISVCCSRILLKIIQNFAANNFIYFDTTSGSFSSLGRTSFFKFFDCIMNTRTRSTNCRRNLGCRFFYLKDWRFAIVLWV